MRRKTKKAVFLVFIFLIATLFSYWAYRALSELLDPNNYKDKIAGRIETAIGLRVSIGNAELKIRGGLGIRLYPIKIYGKDNQETIFSANSFLVKIRLAPLLNKEIAVKSITLTAPVFSVSPEVTGERHEQLEKILAVIGRASRFRIIKGVLKFKKREGDDTPFPVDTARFDIMISKGAKRSMPYTFILKALLNYAANRQGTVQFKGGITHVPEELNLGEFGFHARVNARNIKKEIIDYFEPRFIGTLGRFPGMFDFVGLFKGRPLHKFEANGTIRFVPAEGSYKKGSPLANSANLKFAAFKGEDSFSFKKFDLKLSDLGARGQIGMTGIHSRNPLLTLSLAVDPLELSRLRENIYLKYLPEKVREVIEKRLIGGTVHLDSLKFRGPWRSIEEGNLPDIQDNLELKFSLSNAEGTIGGHGPPILFANGNGSFAFAKSMFSFNNVSFNFMDSSVSNLSGTVINPNHPVLKDASLKSDLNLDNIQALLEAFSLKGKPPLIGQLGEMKGIVHADLNISSTGDAPSLYEYTGSLKAKDISLAKRGHKTPFTEISGTVKLASHKKREDKGIFLEFEDISATYGQSRLYGLSGTFQEKKGDKGRLSLILKGLLDLRDINDLADLSINDARVNPFAGLQPTSGKAKVEFEINGETKDLNVTGSLRLINASFKPPYKGLFPKGLNGRLKIGRGWVSIEDIKGKLGESNFSVSGRLDNLSEGAPVFDLKAYLKGDGGYLKEMILPHTPGGKESLLNDASLDGPVKIKFKAKGGLKKMEFDAHGEFTEAELHYGKGFRKARGKECGLELSGLFERHRPFIIKRYKFSYAGSVLSGENSVIDPNNKGYRLNLVTDGFPVSDLLDLVGAPYNSSITGSLITRLNLTESGANNASPRLNGTIRLKGIGYHFDGMPNPLRDINGHFRIQGEKITIKSLSIKFADSEVLLDGTYKGFRKPKYELNLRSPLFRMNDILPKVPITTIWIRKFLGDSERFRNTTGEIHIDVEKGDFKFLRWNDLKGDLKIKKETFYLHNASALLHEGVLRSSGRIGFLSESGMDFLLNLMIESAPAERVMYILGPGFDNSLKGKISFGSSIGGHGFNWDEVRKSLEGKLGFSVRNGQYYKPGLLRGLDGIFQFKNKEKEKKKDEAKPKEFFLLGGKFQLKKGAAFTKDFVILTKNRKTSMVGKILLGEEKLNLSVAVVPWRQAGNFVSKIPLVGRILTGGDEKGILVSYYNIKGKMGDPKVSAMPLKSIGKKIEGMLKAILMAPVDIITGGRQ